VATILEQETQATINDWFQRSIVSGLLVSIPLEESLRTSHLRGLFRDLGYLLPGRALASPAAGSHGLVRRSQGYTAAMLVEESRMLEVSIFRENDTNAHRIDFKMVLADVMVIADEVDSQLAQAVNRSIKRLPHEPICIHYRCLIKSVKTKIMRNALQSAVRLLLHVLCQSGLPLACFVAPSLLWAS
jgi:hypothetical protein